MIGAISTNDVLTAVAIIVSVFGGGLAMAWRLGSVERSVTDATVAMRDVSSTVAALGAQVNSLGNRVTRLETEQHTRRVG